MSAKSQNFNLSALLLVILAVGAAYYIYSHGGFTLGTKFSSENVKVSNLDLKSGANPLPSDLPIDVANVTEHTDIYYADRGVEVYTVAYRSGNQLEGLYNIYNNYLRLHGYTNIEASKSPNLITLEGDMGANSIFVALSPDIGGSNLVKVGYSIKK